MSSDLEVIVDEFINAERRLRESVQRTRKSMLHTDDWKELQRHVASAIAFTEVGLQDGRIDRSLFSALQDSLHQIERKLQSCL